MSLGEIEKALETVVVHSRTVPKAFEIGFDSCRGGRSQIDLEENWHGLSLEERVSLTACLMGKYAMTPESSRLISEAYLALCHGMTLESFGKEWLWSHRRSERAMTGCNAVVKKSSQKSLEAA